MNNQTQENYWYIFEQWMKDNGYWDQYVANYDTSYSTIALLSDCIDSAFKWDMTKEGYDFWESVYTKWWSFIDERKISMGDVVVPHTLQTTEEQPKTTTQDSVDMNAISEVIQQLQQGQNEQEPRKFYMKGTLSCVVATYHNATGKDKIEDVNDLSKFSKILNIYLEG